MIWLLLLLFAGVNGYLYREGEGGKTLCVFLGIAMNALSAPAALSLFIATVKFF